MANNFPLILNFNVVNSISELTEDVIKERSCNGILSESLEMRAKRKKDTWPVTFSMFCPLLPSSQNLCVY